ncbi:hypothetical protein TURU_100219 [Turdus rufiventris]|nr:hypothetical protein TURU_100219 [Turdus rufiventris]
MGAGGKTCSISIILVVMCHITTEKSHTANLPSIGFRDEGMKYTFVDVTKLSGVVEAPEGWDAIQRDLDKLEQWAHVNLIRLNKAKYKVLHLGQGNPQHQHRLGNERTESTSAEENFGVLVGDSWM